MLHERGFHLGGIDVGTAREDRGRCDDRRGTGSRPRPSIPGPPATPSRHGARLGPDVPVRRLLGRLHPDLADLTRGQVVADVVGDLHPPRHRPADGTFVREPLRTADHGDALRLGTGVELVDRVGTEPVDPLVLEPRRARGRHVEDGPERRQVPSEPLGCRQAPDAQHHRGHEHRPLDLVTLDQLERVRRVEASHHDDVPAAQQARYREHERTVVVQGSRDELGLSSPSPCEPPQLRRTVRVGRAVLSGHDDLGPSGAASRRRRLERGAMRSGRIGSSLASASGSIGAVYDERRLDERHDLVALSLGKAKGDRLRCRAELPRRDAPLVEGDPVRQADRDEVALADAEPRERVGEPVRTRLEVSPQHRFAFARRRRAVGLLLGEAAHRGADGHHGHGVGPTQNVSP